MKNIATRKIKFPLFVLISVLLLALLTEAALSPVLAETEPQEVEQIQVLEEEISAETIVAEEILAPESVSEEVPSPTELTYEVSPSEEEEGPVAVSLETPTESADTTIDDPVGDDSLESDLLIEDDVTDAEKIEDPDPSEQAEEEVEEEEEEEEVVVIDDATDVSEVTDTSSETSASEDDGQEPRTDETLPLEPVPVEPPLDTVEEEPDVSDPLDIDVDDDPLPIAPFSLPSLLQQAEPPVDFARFISVYDISRMENGIWVPVGETIDHDETVRVMIEYTIPAGQIEGHPEYLFYQIPSGISLDQEQSDSIRDLYDNTRILGSYTVTTDGRIEIRFDPEMLVLAEGTVGTVGFQGKADFYGAGEDGVIDFGDARDSIKVDLSYDLSLTKTRAQISSDKNFVQYRLVARTTEGTDGSLTISDAFADNETTASLKPQYVLNDPEKPFAVTKVSGSTVSQLERGLDYDITTAMGQFTITELAPPRRLRTL